MARRQHPVVIAKLLADAGGPLRPVLHRAAGLQAEESRLRALLDDDVSEQVESTYLRGDTLVVLVRSSVWATRLRFLAPALLQRLSGDDGLPPVRDVRVVVGRSRPELPTARTTDGPRPTLPSAQAAIVLSASAAALPVDDPLRETLQRIASRAGQRRDD